VSSDDAAVVRLAELLASARLSALVYQRQWLPRLDESAHREVGRSASDALKQSWPADAAGWTLDSNGSAVIYRPSAHADPVLASLADVLAAHADGVPADRAAQDTPGFRRHQRSAVFRDLTSREGGGFLYAACLRCHVVDAQGRSFHVSWRSSDRTKSTDLTSFDHHRHSPSLGPATACEACHQVAGTAPASESAPVTTDRMGLAPVRKQHCLTCHSPGRSPTACLTCHRYHATSAAR
jgi:hypothetical protein